VFYFLTFFEGFIISFGLITALGPQNAYVLRQGIRGRHAVQVASVCFVADAVLITLGVMGVGRFVSESPVLAAWLGWGGVVFLSWFAIKSIRSAMHPEVLDAAKMEDAAGDAAGQGVKIAMLHATAFSLLNPWAYLDTMVLIGGISVRYTDDAMRLAFLVGAITASCVWFYGLAFGGKKAAPWFQKRSTWRVLDSVIAVIMIVVALNLVRLQLTAA
jgi:L-lysine exporter family protein LysE/ArgO